ncbi:hypothetical protein PFMALIP_06294, partial [Plasmodium falciparum MaliPS096_E11]
MGTQSGGGSSKEKEDKYKNAEDAKHLLDMIGEDIYKKAKEAALPYNNALHGLLTRATYPRDRKPTGSTPADPCGLEYQYHTNVTSTVINPCANRSKIRFSDVHGGQCTRNRIKDSTSVTVGACAPYRRLHVCDQNLEQIEPIKITNTHNLLVDVCQAAKFEGASITQDYPKKYRAKYNDSPSKMCTMLARSFADIGDIIRGKDLYLRYNRKDKTDKLQEQLKKYFKNIYDNLMEDLIKDPTKNGAKDRYKDENGGNYYQLREDWWALNRRDVWKAITCNAAGDGKYFRKTCSNDTSDTNEKCRCVTNDVPTYFDYVPQYLRWFEEWAEDFCRKRKHKLQNAKEQCRGDGEGGKKRYCSGNGYNCKETIRAQEKLVEGDDCHKCSVACKPFVEWLDNQKLEFDKQKRKYGNEIKKNHERTMKIGGTTINNLYVQEFYEQLKKNYQDVDDFLEKLSKEQICEGHPEVEVNGEKARSVNFKNHETNRTFCRTEYCKPCPLCGVTEEKGNWTPKKEDCAKGNKKEYPPENTTTIPKLPTDKGKTSILQKYKTFCQNAENNKQINKDVWQCHYEDTDRSNICVLQHDEKDKAEEDVMSYYSFFYGSIIDMLKDSVDWREKLKSCINNETKACKNGCKSKCDCYKRWVEGKKKEWTQIKDHFGKQKDMIGEIKGEAYIGIILEFYLKNNFLQNIKDAKVDAKAIEKFTDLLQKKNNQETDDTTKTIIDDFLEEEERFAETCKKCEDPQNPSSVARSNTPTQAPAPPDPATDDHASSEEEEEEDEDEEEGGGAVETEEKKEEKKDACATVNSLLQNRSATDDIEGCRQKDDGKIPYPRWTCEIDKFEEGHAGACMPPRRQKLCLYYIAHESQTRNINKEDDLKDAFIKTAAAETFFAWHYYNSKNANAQEQLKAGKIPPDFLRSMFYTYGDYRDICLDTDISKKQNDVAKAKDKIDQIFRKKDGSKPPSGLSRQEWWKTNGPKIWEGMLCALTKYVTDTDNKIKIKNDYSYVRVNQSQNGNPSLEEFAAKPQFLRWMIEWGEEFCVERQKKENIIKDACNEKNSSDVCNPGSSCKSACKAYEDYVNKKKGQFWLQTGKFVRNANEHKAHPEYKDYKYKEGSSPIQGNEYLLQKCDTGKCSCMTGNVLSVSPKDEPFGRYAHKYSEKCDCYQGKHKPGELQPPAPPPQPPPPPAIPAPATPGVKAPCEIVEELFKDVTTLQKACSTKYEKGREKFPSWKCIPSGNTGSTTSSVNGEHTRQRRSAETATGGPAADGGKSGSDSSSIGATCIPPRRRRLYVGKLEEWVNSGKTETSEPHVETTEGPTSPQTSGGQNTPSGKESSQSDKLRNAFIESAAVETFFLWDRYKKIKDKEEKERKERERENGGLETLDGDTLSGEETPQTLLQTGKIPPDFLRLMFYTLGDYRDILFSGSKDNTKSSTYNDILKGDKEMEQREGNIKTAIEKHFSNIVETPPNSDKRKTWWDKNAKYIWDGMICSLTYNTDSNGKDKKIEQIQDADDGKNLFQKLKENNDYDKVSFGGTEGPINTNAGKDAPNSQPPTLKQFTSRPTYFRYLEEWGETFCRERKKRLELVKKACREKDGGDPKYCSGDGHDCEQTYFEHDDMFKDPNCPSCYEQCRKYRKWIDIKFEEFHNQKNKYEEEKQKLNSNSNGDKKFCEEIKKHTNAEEFLKTLKHCKDGQTDEVKKSTNKDNKINFNDPKTTFGPLEYCKTCPPNKVNCNGPSRRSGGNDQCTAVNGNGNTWDSVFNGNGEKTTIEVEMIDRRAPYMENDLKDLFKTSSLFKGIRKQNWTCKFNKAQNKDVCKLDQFKDNIDLNEYTTFKVFLEYWLEDFLYGYYILKKKNLIKQCTQKGEKACDKESKNYCACVKEWVDQKQTEWGNIKNHFQKRNQDDGENIKSKVEMFLEKLIPQMNLTNGKKKIQQLNEFLRSYECNCTESSGKKGDTPKDIVECLLDKLGEKAKQCKDNHQTCDQSLPQSGRNLPHVGDDEEEENPVTQPNICPSEQVEQKPDGEDTCEEDKKDELEENSVPSGSPTADGEETPKALKPQEEVPEPDVEPPPQLQSDEPSNSISDILSSTIPFGIAIALTSIVFLFLK